MIAAQHLSIDIETLGTSPDSVVLSIGIVTDTAREMHLFLDIEQQTKNGRKIDASTLLWWFGQKQEVWDSQRFAKRIAPSIAESKITTFIKKNCDLHTLVWANSPSFDLVILRDLFSGETPWRFWQERDIRTARMVIGRTQPGIAHSALDDAKAQLADAIVFSQLAESHKQ